MHAITGIDELVYNDVLLCQFEIPFESDNDDHNGDENDSDTVSVLSIEAMSSSEAFDDFWDFYYMFNEDHTPEMDSISVNQEEGSDEEPEIDEEMEGAEEGNLNANNDDDAESVALHFETHIIIVETPPCSDADDDDDNTVEVILVPDPIIVESPCTSDEE
ncbi:unnamed protein product [Rotaria sp. Silwood1]|nr:unnamed protein product [Rotaria sp. Silwood1]CAF1656598.1 unnamed protein product [Rotaria sp. Silwood1]